jgi:hypothetical protein
MNVKSNVEIISEKRRSHNFLNLINRKFGKLLVIEELEKNKHSKIMWLCKCDCGNYKKINGDYLKSGDTKSCGCFQSESVIERNMKPKYHWIFTILRETAKKSGKCCELTYGDVCEFTNIINCHYCNENIMWKEHGVKGQTHGYQLDRKDNSIGYTMENCVVCCKSCNRIKGNKFTHTEMLKIGPFIKTIIDERKHD